MKILLFDVNYQHSSTGKIVHTIANRLITDGHQAKVLYGRGKKSTDGIGVRIASPMEVYFHALMTRLTGLVGFFSYFATRKAIRTINKFEPDIIHLHELHGYYINFGKLLKHIKFKQIAVVWTFHCEFAYTGKCGHSYDCEKWKTKCGSCPRLKEYPASSYFDFTGKMHEWKKKDFNDLHPLIITTPSKWLADRVKQSFLNDANIRVVYNGIDVDTVFFPRNYEDLLLRYKLDNKKIILSVAPNIMDERKGGRWVVETASHFDKSHIFIMIGADGRIKDLPENVISIPRTTNQEELAKFYSLADVLLLTSQKETFSLVTAESLACGTPVVGFESGAPSEVAPKGYGYFVPYGDVRAIVEVLRGIFSNKTPMNNASNCKEFAAEKYSNQSMYTTFLNLYTELLRDN